MTETRQPEEIRRDIDTTRAELGETAAALAEKTDVKARAGEKVEELKSRVRDSTPGSASSAATQAQRTARENPLPVAVAGAFAAGLVFGRLSKR